jgi:hypothetical protein
VAGHIDDGATALLDDAAKGLFELWPTLAAQRAKGLARDAAGVKPHQGLGGLLQRSKEQQNSEKAFKRQPVVFVYGFNSE